MIQTTPSSGSGFGSDLHKPDGPAAPGASKDAPYGGVDAGLRSLDHYKRALPRWRYNLRQRLLPIVRWETPHLAFFQSRVRTPALDSYFAITANLGTHTFFMVGLPILFWCGLREFGKGLVHILAEGVFFTGFIKDLCSLPRPLSPPLHRVTMSGSVSLEYGFPSTHSANAVSVAVYGILLLRSEENRFSLTMRLALETLSYLYAVSIIIGRLYCGMHGFLDVIVGSVMGAAISLVEFYWGPAFTTWMYENSVIAPLAVVLVIIVLVRVHPEPADDCPCFDDSVSFAGVVMGIEIGMWRFARSPWLSELYSATNFNVASLGWPRTVARICLGVLVVFVWRGAMKPALLKVLPHLFRIIEMAGLDLPRRFFMPASKYKNVPLSLRDDNVLPNVSDIPRMMRSIRGPGKGRSVSIGPQSAADAYETLAYRERRRRESIDSESGGGGGLKKRSSLATVRQPSGSGGSADDRVRTSGTQHGIRLAKCEQMMSQGTVAVTPPAEAPASTRGPSEEAKGDFNLRQQDELGEKEIFSRLVKPRVRYDVEVVTKLVVYTGIGWLAVDGILLIFEFVCLGAGHATAAWH